VSSRPSDRRLKKRDGHSLHVRIESAAGVGWQKAVDFDDWVDVIGEVKRCLSMQTTACREAQLEGGGRNYRGSPRDEIDMGKKTGREYIASVDSHEC